jgi:malate dehydrogenase (oxaloacetate-decarboxylating)
MRLTERRIGDVSVVVSGAGAAGVAVTKILQSMGVREIVVMDRHGAIHAGRDGLTPVKQELADTTNPEQRRGGAHDILPGADVLIGVSGGVIPEDAVARMAPDAVIFALANPDPEVHPSVAHRYAAVVATGRSDFPNQINNVLAFPGIFRGALDVRATNVSEGMKRAAAEALAGIVGADLAADYVVPGPFDTRVAPAVAAAVAEAARREGIARL